jgi:hypothetical protein
MIADFSLSIFILLLMAAVGVLNQKANKLTLMELNTYPGYLYMMAFNLFAPTTAGLCVGLLHYARHADLRKTVTREARYYYNVGIFGRNNKTFRVSRVVYY